MTISSLLALESNLLDAFFRISMNIVIFTAHTRHTCQAGCAFEGSNKSLMYSEPSAEALLQTDFPSKYSMCPAGFYRSAGCFFTFYLICVGSMLQMSAIYRQMAAASPNMDIASATGEMQVT